MRLSRFLKLLYIVIVIGIVFCICFILRHIYLVSLANNSEIPMHINAIVDLIPDNEYVLPSVTGVQNDFTCTGLVYDSRRDSFWIGNFGKLSPSDAQKQPSIVQVSNDFSKVISIIELDDSDIDLQGVSFDRNTDTIWYSDGKRIINCDMYGNIISYFYLGDFQKYKPNGVLYDNRDNTIWVLCFYKYLLHYNVKGELLTATMSDYKGQDHLCLGDDGRIYFSVGDDYVGEDNFVACFSKDNMRVEFAYRVKGAYAVEGIYIKDGYLYVANDGYYHMAKNTYNYIARYRLPRSTYTFQNLSHRESS